MMHGWAPRQMVRSERRPACTCALRLEVLRVTNDCLVVLQA